MLARLNDGRPEIRFEDVQLGFGRGQTVSSPRPDWPFFAQHLAGTRVFQPVHVFQRQDLDRN